MANFKEARVKLTNRELKKLNLQQKIRRNIKKLNKKNIEEEELPHELFLTTRQTTKIRNGFANNILDIKLSKAHISKII